MTALEHLYVINHLHVLLVQVSGFIWASSGCSVFMILGLPKGGRNNRAVECSSARRQCRVTSSPVAPQLETDDDAAELDLKLTTKVPPPPLSSGNLISSTNRPSSLSFLWPSFVVLVSCPARVRLLFDEVAPI